MNHANGLIKIVCLLISIMLLGNPMASGSIMHIVDPEDPNAFPDIQQAIDAALDGDEIMVMPGTYTSKGNAVVRIDNKELSLFSWGGPEVTHIDGQNVRRGIFCNSGISGSTLISGFTIKNGLDDELGGGGMYLVESEAIINNCHFLTNHAIYEGGAVKSIAQDGDGPVFNQCQFTENGVEHWLGAGGAAFMQGNGEFLNCEFTLNSTAFGGALYSAYSENLSIRSSDFNENTSSDYGGAVRAFESTLDIHQCTFNGNSQGDKAFGGGAIATERCDGLVTFCTFEMNSSGGFKGGAILLNDSSPRFENCDFNHNGISEFSPNLMDSRGGAIHIQGGASRFWDCWLENNYAGSGGTISIDTGTLEVRGTHILDGLAIWENGGGIKATNIDSLVLHDCTFRNNRSLGSGFGAALSSPNVVLATNCTFDENENENSAGGHVGLHGIDSGSRFENCEFTNGLSFQEGAGMQAWNIGALTLIDCNFDSNLINDFSGPIPNGAGLNIKSDPDRSDPILIDGCSFSGNRICCDNEAFFIGYGGGLHASGEHIHITNSRFSRNVAMGGGSIAASATIRNCSISGGASLSGGGGLYAFDGTRIFDSRITGGADGTGGAIYTRSSLELERVTIEGGFAEGLYVWDEEEHASCYFGDKSDVSIRDSMICGGIPRNIYGNYDDLGENHITEHCCPGDFNHDGEVDSADLGQLLALWLEPALGTPADLNDDGTIDGADLALILTYWGDCD